MVGSDNFSLFRSQNSLFVDKSMFCREFLEDLPLSSALLRPRRFGKTLLLTMLEAFLSVRKPGEDLGTRRSLFNNLKIADDEVYFGQHFAQYPVIYLSLKVGYLFA